MAVVGQLNKAAISFPVEPRGAYSARMGIPSTNSIGATIAFSARRSLVVGPTFEIGPAPEYGAASTA